MPSLYPALERLQPRFILTAAFAGNGTLSRNATQMRKNVIRLVDKAIFEYTNARNAILNQIAESQREYEELLKGRIIYMFGFTDHMENCLNAIRRILGLLERLRSEANAPVQDHSY